MAVAENHLIERLPRKDRSRLLALCEPCPLVLHDVLCEADTPAQHAYFPVEGFVSLIVWTAGNPGLEVGMVGREGMLCTQLTLGTASVPWRLLVQGEGMARRIGAKALRAELAQSPALQLGLWRYVSVLMAQLATASSCLRFHLIGPRLARWLLMSQDRAHTDHFQVTHEFLAYMLGVRRVGVTNAAGALQRDGLVSYHRGHLTVLDRPGLEAAACSCYAAGRSSYADLIG